MVHNHSSILTRAALSLLSSYLVFVCHITLSDQAYSQETYDVQAPELPSTRSTPETPKNSSLTTSYQIDHQRLTFTAPNTEWQPLTLKQIHTISALGVLGGIKSQSILGLVLVEPSTRLGLNDYAQALLDGSPLQEMLIESVDEVSYLGQNALRIVYSGDEGNGRSRYLSYIFLLGGKGFQVIAGGRVGLAKVENLEEFSRAIKLTLASQQVTTPTIQTQDEVGLSWEVTSGVFQDALSGLVIQPKGSWRITFGDQVRKLNPHATAGLIHLEKQLYVLFFDRPCPFTDAQKCSAWSTTERFSDLGIVPNQKGTLGWNYLGDTRYFTQLYAPHKKYSYLYYNHVVSGRVLETYTRHSTICKFS